MKSLKHIAVILCSLLLLAAGCNDRTTKNVRTEKGFVPDEQYLSHSISLTEEKDSYCYPKTNEGYELAGIELKNPVPATKINLDRGKQLFEGHCAHCHGLKGNADAPMILKGKYPPPPPFYIRLKTINEGKMFHSITLGRNYMPAHAEELDTTERWQVITYIIRTFKNKK
jgi:hypothetical protein